MKKRREEDWKKSEDKILQGLVSRGYTNKKHLMETLELELPKVTATQALYHAVNHLNIKFKIHTQMTDEAMVKIVEMCEVGYDSKEIMQFIQTKYSITRSKSYYHKVRFFTRRGEYQPVKVKKGSAYTIQRNLMIQIHALQNGQTFKEAETALRGKLAAFTSTLSHETQDLGGVSIVSRRRLSKITTLNKVSEALGLGFGALIKHVRPGDMETMTDTSILKHIFEDIGLNKDALKRV